MRISTIGAEKRVMPIQLKRNVPSLVSSSPLPTNPRFSTADCCCPFPSFPRVRSEIFLPLFQAYFLKTLLSSSLSSLLRVPSLITVLGFSFLSSFPLQFPSYHWASRILPKSYLCRQPVLSVLSFVRFFSFLSFFPARDKRNATTNQSLRRIPEM